jgi:hypothetical protein
MSIRDDFDSVPICDLSESWMSVFIRDRSESVMIRVDP